MDPTPSSVHQTAQKGYATPDLYEKVRPTSTAESIAHITSVVPAAATMTIVDLAAGTGKLTRSLQSHFQKPPTSKLVAVQPVDDMREIFQKSVPGVEIVQGTADSIPFPDESVDAIFIGQAFDWFANENSLVEFYRVLKPGAPVIMIWNTAGEDNSFWVKKIREEYEKFCQNCPQYRYGTWKGIWNGDFARNNFTPLESRCWNWEMQVSLDSHYIWERIASISYIASLDQEELNQLREKIEGIIAAIPEKNIPYPRGTDAFWAFKK